MSAPAPSGPAPAPYPGWAPYQPPVHKPPIEHLRPLVGDFLLTVAVLFGLALLWIASLGIGISDDPGSRDAWRVIYSIGALALTAGLLMAAILRVDVDPFVRAAFVIGAILVVAWPGGGFWP